MSMLLLYFDWDKVMDNKYKYVLIKYSNVCTVTNYLLT